MTFFKCGFATSNKFLPARTPNCIRWIAANRSGKVLNSGNISQINDLSPSKQNFVQVTATAQPAYNTNPQKGLATITFDGINDYLQSAMSSAHTGNAITVMYAAKKLSHENVDSVINLVDTTKEHDYNQVGTIITGYTPGSTTLQSYRAVPLSTVSNPASNTPYVFCTVCDGVNNTAYLNGAAGSPVASSGNFNIHTIFLGTRWINFSTITATHMVLFEIMVFNVALTAKQISDNTQYLLKTWI